MTLPPERKATLRQAATDALCIVCFALVAFFYFCPAVLDGRRLNQHDNSAADGLSIEIESYRAAHNGETPRWINSIFSGMPTYQVAPSYDSMKPLTSAEQLWHLWLPDYVWYLFASMLGFYLLLRVLDFRQWMAALGAIVWAFSTYFLIIIAAGHIWKVITLAYIPPTLAGMALLYKGKYLWGTLLTALFAALQVKSNHVQMTYYFLIVELAVFVAFLCEAITERKLAHFAKATALLVVSAALAIAINASNLFHTYEYAKDTMRSKSELVKAGEDRANQTSSGLDRDYITMWSYGVGETWTLLIPNAKGGASVPLQSNKTAMKHADAQLNQGGIYRAFTQYFGEQPGTSGPVYIGAAVCLLFVLSLLVLPNRSPLKWALLAATVLAVLLSWGKNFMGFTNWFIDHVPMYAKFRTVSSILVVAEFTIPLLAMLGLYRFVKRCSQPDQRVWASKSLIISAAITLLCCLAFAIHPSLLGPCVSSSDEMALTNYVSQGYFDEMTKQRILASIASMRAAMVQADAWRSALIVALAAALLGWYYRRSGKALAAQRMLQAKDRPREASPRLGATLCIALTALCLIDLWGINKRYLNDGMFTTPPLTKAQQPGEADRYILGRSGDGRNYRVLNFTVSTFNDNTTSYFYSSIGGYHPAKMRRYQELIDGHITQEMRNVYTALSAAPIDTAASLAAGRYPVYDLSAVDTDRLFPVLNMLNTRWFILGGQNNQPLPIENTTALGNAWFVNNVHVAANANEEMDALGTVNLRNTAIVAEDFLDVLGGKTAFVCDSTASIEQTALSSTAVSYRTHATQEQLAVFSEVYYPGWQVTIDGTPAQLVRANYVLRAMIIPAGDHTVSMTFNPPTVRTTETVAYIALGVLLLVLLFAVAYWWRQAHKKPAQDDDWMYIPGYMSN